MSKEGSWTEPLVLTPIEVAKLLRIGRGTAYEQIRCGTIPSIRMGRRILVPRAALMQMLEMAKNDGLRS
jgi:excisionase family DNA binding protein